MLSCTRLHLYRPEQDAPWFAHLSYLSPHPPFIVPEPFNDMYAAEQGPLFHRHGDWQAEAAQHPYAAWELDRQKRKKFLPGHKGKVRDFSEDEFRTIRAIYWGMVSEVDSQLGRVWDSIRAADAWENTVIVLTSDHAEMMGDHYMLGKGGYFDQSYHLPLIVRDPRAGASNGSAVDLFTEAVDTAPTLIEMMGGDVPAHLDGRSLTPFLTANTPPDWREAAHWEFDFRSIADGPERQPFGLSPQQCNLAVLRTKDWKYVHFNGGLPPLLFDLRSDPGELHNIAGEPAYQSIRLDMAERMLSWRAEHLDQSLALSELTETGVAGSYADAAWRAWR